MGKREHGEEEGKSGQRGFYLLGNQVLKNGHVVVFVDSGNNTIEIEKR